MDRFKHIIVVLKEMDLLDIFRRFQGNLPDNPPNLSLSFKNTLETGNKNTVSLKVINGRQGVSAKIYLGKEPNST